MATTCGPQFLKEPHQKEQRFFTILTETLRQFVCDMKLLLNVTNKDWHEPPELSSGTRKTKKVLTREHDGTERETPSLLSPWD